MDSSKEILQAQIASLVAERDAVKAAISKAKGWQKEFYADEKDLNKGIYDFEKKVVKSL